MPTRTGEPTARELRAALAGAGGQRARARGALPRSHRGRRTARSTPPSTSTPRRRSRRPTTRIGARRRRAAAAARAAGLDQGLDRGAGPAVPLGLVGARRPRAREDATTVARLRDGGCRVPVQDDVPEYTWSTETDNAIFGRTNNPYDLEQRPAARAAARRRCTPSTHRPSGSDRTGSARSGSRHFCGTVGLRPSVGLVPETGVWPTTRDSGMLDMGTLGPMGRDRGGRRAAAAHHRRPGRHRPARERKPRRGSARRRRLARSASATTLDDGAAPCNAGHARGYRGRGARPRRGGRGGRGGLAAAARGRVDLAFAMMAADGGARARADLAPAGGRHMAQMSWLLEGLEPLELSAAGFFELMQRWAPCAARLRRFVSPATTSSLPGGRRARHRSTAAAPATTASSPTTSSTATRSRTRSAASPCAACRPAGAGAAGGDPGRGPADRDHVALAAAAVVERERASAVPVPPPLASLANLG